MGGVEKPSPINIGAAGSSFSSDLHHLTDPDAGLSEAQKKEVVSLFSHENCLGFCSRWIQCADLADVDNALLGIGAQATVET